MTTFTYYQPPKEVHIPKLGMLREHSKDYTIDLVLETDKRYNITLNWFPYKGFVNIYLNTTLVAANVGPLDVASGILNYTITIPGVRTSKYIFRVINNNNV